MAGWQDESVVEVLRDKFHGAIYEMNADRGETTILVARDCIRDICQFLKDNLTFRFNYLTDLCGADYPYHSERFLVVYHLYSFPNNVRLRLKVRTNGEEPVPSVTSVWQAANWMEREVYDLYGVRFDGHPNLERILMPEDWSGHPLRKDYPLYDETVDQAHMSGTERIEARGGPIFAEQHLPKGSS